LPDARRAPNEDEVIMAKVRHIAIRSDDVEATAAFFQQAFGLRHADTTS
jgi:hypothetical protein